MDDQSLSKRIRTLVKAVTAEPPSVVIQLLEELKKDVAPTEEQIRVSLSQPAAAWISRMGCSLAGYSPQKPALP
jgi:hypothetical protein